MSDLFRPAPPALLLSLACCLVAAPAAAQNPAPNPPAAPPATQAASPAAPAPASGRTAKAVIDDYARAIGGARALGKHRNVYLKREIAVKGIGVGGTEERWATSSGQLLSVTNLPGIGIIKQGSTGKVHWAQDPINGLRILTGTEAEQARIEGTWNADLKLGKLYKTIKLAARPEGAPKDDPLDCLEMVPPRGHPAIACFDSRTHLRAFQQGKQSTPQGEVPYSARLSDWREVEGVKLPFREETTAGPMTVEAKLAEVKFNQKLPADLFKMPRP
jgi:zinc protease